MAGHTCKGFRKDKILFMFILLRCDPSEIGLAEQIIAVIPELFSSIDWQFACRVISSVG